MTPKKEKRKIKVHLTTQITKNRKFMNQNFVSFFPSPL